LRSDDRTSREFCEAVDGREKEFAQLEQRQQPMTALRVVHHRQDAQIFFVHHAQRFGGGRVRPHTQDAALHHVGNLRRNVGDKFRRGHAERFQHKINPVVRVAAARGHRFLHAREPLEFRVTDGGTDRVSVGVAVADDKNFAHANPGTD
jgi:hypothetical protein